MKSNINTHIPATLISREESRRGIDCGRKTDASSISKEGAIPRWRRVQFTQQEAKDQHLPNTTRGQGQEDQERFQNVRHRKNRSR